MRRLDTPLLIEEVFFCFLENSVARLCVVHGSRRG
jgi:hypothetical protein